jgi:hypothetical protein
VLDGESNRALARIETPSPVVAHRVQQLQLVFIGQIPEDREVGFVA